MTLRPTLICSRDHRTCREGAERCENASDRAPHRRLPPPAALSLPSSAFRRARLPRCSVATRRIAERALNQQDGGGSRLHLIADTRSLD